MQEYFFALFGIDFQFPLLDRFLVHFRHITKEESLLPDLTELALQILNFELLQLLVSLVIRVILKLVDFRLDKLNMLSVGEHELLILLLECSLEAEVHELDHLVEPFDVGPDLLMSTHLLEPGGVPLIRNLISILLKAPSILAFNAGLGSGDDLPLRGPLD